MYKISYYHLKIFFADFFLDIFLRFCWVVIAQLCNYSCQISSIYIYVILISHFLWDCDQCSHYCFVVHCCAPVTYPFLFTVLHGAWASFLGWFSLKIVSHQSHKVSLYILAYNNIHEYIAYIIYTRICVLVTY